MIASGEPIDQRDDAKLTALAYALKNRDLGAARRLLVLGARPDTSVGFGELPVALMPVLTGDIEAVRMMRHFGADYSMLHYQGETAFDYAKRSGNLAMLEVLGRKETTL